MDIASWQRPSRSERPLFDDDDLDDVVCCFEKATGVKCIAPTVNRIILKDVHAQGFSSSLDVIKSLGQNFDPAAPRRRTSRKNISRQASQAQSSTSQTAGLIADDLCSQIYRSDVNVNGFDWLERVSKPPVNLVLPPLTEPTPVLPASLSVRVPREPDLLEPLEMDIAAFMSLGMDDVVTDDEPPTPLSAPAELGTSADKTIFELGAFEDLQIEAPVPTEVEVDKDEATSKAPFLDVTPPTSTNSLLPEIPGSVEDDFQLAIDDAFISAKSKEENPGIECNGNSEMDSQIEMHRGMVHQAPLKGFVSNDGQSNPASVEVPRKAIESRTNSLPDITSGFSRSLTSAARLIGIKKEPSVVANDPLLLSNSSVSALVQSDPLLFEDDEEEDDDEETDTEFDSDEDGPL